MSYSFVTYFWSTQRLQHNTPTVWIIYSATMPLLGTQLQGTLYWSMNFGYPENQTALAYLVVHEQVYPLKRLQALFRLFQQVFTVLGLPHVLRTQNYRVNRLWIDGLKNPGEQYPHLLAIMCCVHVSLWDVLPV